MCRESIGTHRTQAIRNRTLDIGQHILLSRNKYQEEMNQLLGILHDFIPACVMNELLMELDVSSCDM